MSSFLQFTLKLELMAKEVLVKEVQKLPYASE